MQVACVKDEDSLLHVGDFPDEHDLCEPGYPRLEAFEDGVWHLKLQVWLRYTRSRMLLAAQS